MNEFVARNGIIANNNSLIIGALTATTIIKSGGTSNQFLMADGSISLGSSSSGVTGNGTLNYVPKFSGSTNNIANSNILDTGSLITLSSNTTVIGSFSANTVSATTFSATSGLTIGVTNLTEDLLKMSNASESTGLYIFSNSGITSTATTTFNVGAVQGWIINPSNILNTNPIFVSFSGASGQTTPYLSSATATYVLVNSGSTLTLQNTRPTVTDRRNNIFLGVIGHPSGTITGIGNAPDIIMNEMSQVRAMFDPIRFINDGITIYNNGATLALANTAGNLFGLGIGFVTNGNNAPSVLAISVGAPSTFQYRTQTGTTTPNTTLVSAGTYDVGGVITAIPGPSATSTNQRFYLLANGSIRAQFGQTTYSTLANAVAAAANESFVVFSNNRNLGILIGLLAIRKDATDLSNTAQAQFLPVSKFGETVGAAAGISVGTLQTAYNNSSDPEITTNSVLGALTVRRGSTLDTDGVFIGQNGGGTNRFLVDGNGGVTGQSFIKSGGTNNQILLADGSVTGVTSFVLTGKTININGAIQSLSALTEFRTAQGDTGVLTYSSGLTTGSVTTIRIAPITGYIVDNETNPAIPTFTFVNYSGTTGITVSTITGGTSTYVLLTSASTISFQNTFPTSADRKSKIWLGKVAHPSTGITAVINEPDYITSPQSFSRDLFQALNYINDGVYPYANGTNLTVNITTGNIHGNGINLNNSRTIPNEVQMGPFVPMSFSYRTQTGGTASPVTSIDPNNYDVGGVITAISGVSTSTLQWIFAVPNTGFVVQYGQTIYATLNDGINAVGRESFNVFQNLIENAILIGVLAVTKGATALTDTSQARFFRADKLGQIIGAQAGISTTTLQNAYNNSLQPQIITNSTMGAIVMRGWDGGTSNTFIIQNSGGTNTLLISENGSLTANTFIKSGGTSNQFLKADGSSDSTIYITGIPNNITGTGTNNVVSKFNSSSGITNSNISDNGTLVSISSDTRVLGVFTANTIVKSGGTSTQYLMADGSVTTLSGISVVTGSGTTNTLPKFGSSTVLTNSGISDDGISININKSIFKSYVTAGTATSPIYEKALIGGVFGANESSISFGNNFVTNGGTEIKFTVNSIVGPTTPIDAMIINSNGNILINTTADTITDKLQISGSVISTSSIQVGNNVNTASASNAGAIRYRVNGTISYVEMSMQTGTSAYGWVEIVRNTW